MKTLTLSKNQMQEDLYIRAEEIFLLTAIIVRRGISNGFVELSGHVQRLYARLHPVDQSYGEGHKPHVLAELNLDMGIDERDSPELQARIHEKGMSESEAYIRYLDHLIAMGKPMISGPPSMAIFCQYPECSCPFDMGADNQCLRGLKQPEKTATAGTSS
ncbi:hypothetical protein [Marinobacter sp. X15-166B]|uniref:hypothetical protein n=1 Tax=Marinobacter sp. X15-166B TaxID=1897620 RepID=UPI00085C3EA4|nr:hypothetical protein [Marinobacter sp. X15-166B]OEY67438.1 hypothetical protein BG841_14025 [Marinobacter sp. X15-166B]